MPFSAKKLRISCFTLCSYARARSVSPLQWPFFKAVAVASPSAIDAIVPFITKSDNSRRSFSLRSASARSDARRSSSRFSLRLNSNDIAPDAIAEGMLAARMSCHIMSMCLLLCELCECNPLALKHFVPFFARLVAACLAASRANVFNGNFSPHRRCPPRQVLRRRWTPPAWAL